MEHLSQSGGLGGIGMAVLPVSCRAVLAEKTSSHANPFSPPASQYRVAGNLPGHSPPGVRVGTPPQAYSFRVSTACVIEDDAAQIPHIGGTVLDSVESKEGEVLRSEVVAAVALLKLQFRRGDFAHHHTLPVSAILRFPHWFPRWFPPRFPSRCLPPSLLSVRSGPAANSASYGNV